MSSRTALALVLALPFGLTACGTTDPENPLVDFDDGPTDTLLLPDSAPPAPPTVEVKLQWSADDVADRYVEVLLPSFELSYDEAYTWEESNAPHPLSVGGEGGDRLLWDVDLEGSLEGGEQTLYLPIRDTLMYFADTVHGSVPAPIDAPEELSCFLGEDLVLGGTYRIDARLDLREAFHHAAGTTDMFWQPTLECSLRQIDENGDEV